MKLDARQRRLSLAGLLAATFAVTVGIEDRRVEPGTNIVAATAPRKASEASADSPRARTMGDTQQIHLEKLETRVPGEASRDPFAPPKPRAVNPGQAAHAALAVAVPIPQATAPPLPYTYMGRLKSGNDVAVFLTQGERNLVAREGDTIDSSYRVDRIEDEAITLTYLPLNQRQTIPIGAPQ